MKYGLRCWEDDGIVRGWEVEVLLKMMREWRYGF